MILLCLSCASPNDQGIKSKGVAFNTTLSQNPSVLQLSPKEFFGADFSHHFQEKYEIATLISALEDAAKKAAKEKKLEEIKACYADEIRRAAAEHGIKPSTIVAIIKVESNGNPKAVSREGAKGLMQLMDGTADLMGVNDPFDPEENIRGGTKYFKEMRRQFGDTATALAAYNQGSARIRNKLRKGGFNPYQLAYVRKVLSIEKKLD